MATTLRIEHLVKRFEGLVAVNDLSIDVQEREIHALIGPNGSGKTTTLNLCHSAYVRPDLVPRYAVDRQADL